jgi:hypothetical protein
MTLIHAAALVYFNNMYHLRPYLLKYFEWKYRHGTPWTKKPSPCFPKKEHDVAKLLIDKSDAFNEEFMKS